MSTRELRSRKRHFRVYAFSALQFLSAFSIGFFVDPLPLAILVLGLHTGVSIYIYSKVL